MKINRIVIDNYKSIKHLDVSLSPKLNAFIGANSTGKSNIFDAINWLLGPTGPSFNSVTKNDHFMGDENNKIKIQLYFDDGNCLELAEEWHDYAGRLKSGLNMNGGDYCNQETRDLYMCAYLGTDRKILDYLPSNKWSLIGRILHEVNKQFLEEEYTHKGQSRPKTEWLIQWLSVIRDRLLFSVTDQSGQNIMQRFLQILQEESARQLNRPITDFKVDLSLYDPWNFYRTLQLIVNESDMDLEFQASDLGMGVQASISVAILQAYSQLNLSNNSPIFIDEPELFLHPQAQNNFYRVLQEISEDKYNEGGELVREGTQIFYTTHSEKFLSTSRFNEIFLVRKNKEKGTHLYFAKPDSFRLDLLYRTGINSSNEEIMLYHQTAYEQTGDSQRANEAFFANKIILVEGQSESMLLPFLFEAVNFDYLKEGISIVRCGNKDEIDRFYRLYTEFGIPCYVIFDGDKHLEGSGKGIDNIKKNKVIMELFRDESEDYPDGKVTENYLGFEYTLNENIGFQTNKKGRDLFIEFKKRYSEESLPVPEWVEEITEKIKLLSTENVESVLKKPESIEVDEEDGLVF